MIEQVAEILGNMAHEVKQCGSKDPALGLLIKQATLQICQLFEPELEPMEKLAIELKDCMYQGEPKPDEGRVDEEILDFIKARLEMTYAYGLSALSWDRGEVAKQILAKTASIIRAENQELRDEERRYFEAKTTEAKELVRAECQQRVDGIFKEIETVYGKSFGSNQIFIGVIPSEDWRALKKKELK